MKWNARWIGLLVVVVLTAGGSPSLEDESRYVLVPDYAWLIENPIPQNQSGLLILDRCASGKIIIVDVLGKEIAAELFKPLGQDIEIGLKESEYRIIIIEEGRIQTLDLELFEGDCYRLQAAVAQEEDRSAEAERLPEPRDGKDTLLGGDLEIGLFAELGFKSSRLFGESALLGGAQIGLSLNRSLFLGVAGYGRLDIYDRHWTYRHDVLDLGYGGFFIEYSIAPRKLFHFKFTSLAGSGESRGRVFYIFEPGVEVLLNLSEHLRLAFGLSHPFVDRDDNGLESPFLTVGLQFGK